MITRLILMLLIFGDNFLVQSQTIIKGNIVDASSNQPLAYVNVGIYKKNIGTISRENGEFSIKIPDENLRDTITFSIVGFQQLDLPVQMLSDKKSVNIKLRERSVELNELTIRENRPIEKKFGIKKRGGPVHFTDGMFSQEDVFEIGQLIKPGSSPAQIMSANLYISNDTEDSASFRINFYRYDGEKPSDRIIAKSILQKHPIKKGWLRFDISDHGVIIDGDFIVSVECIPDPDKTDRKLAYEVKLGGSSKSFYRRNSLGEWNTPPHHYCLFVTALVDKNTPDQIEDREALPTFQIYSDAVKDTFNVFVKLPKNYERSPEKKYPVVYHLDGNAYFEHLSTAINKLSRKKTFTEPILVGIGYRDAYVMDSLRNRDYTFPKAFPADSFAVSGGGNNFYTFLKHELIPSIENKYRADNMNRTIMGHSLGGYFTLYSLYQGINTGFIFTKYVSASPSIYYYDNYIINRLKGSLPDIGQNIKLYLTMGESEITGNVFSDFNNILKTSQFIDLHTRVYPRLEHMGTAVPSFQDGLKFISTGTNRED